MDPNALSRSWSQTADPNPGLAGIGLLMQQDLDPDSPDGGGNKVFIKSVVPGGACDRDGQIQVGDTVLSVNGENVVGLGVADIRERIVGPIGSEVSVCLESGATGQMYERVLLRGNAQPVERMQYASMGHRSSAPEYALSRSMDQRFLSAPQPVPAGAMTNDLEIQRLNRRVMELESQLGITREEYQRTKAMLDSDRNSSEKTVKEIDVIQRKNSHQLMELQSLLNKSEQSRRELEIQVNNSKAREEEFHLAFSRAKEQTEAREQYFADLKQQFDEMRLAYDRDLSQAREEKNESERKRQIMEGEKERLGSEMKALKAKELERREKELTVKQSLHDTEHKLIELKALEEKVRGQSQALHLLFGQWHKDYFINKSKEEAELENYFLA